MRAYLFFLLIPIAIGGEYFLKNFNSFNNQVQWIFSISILLLIVFIPIYALSNSKDEVMIDEEIMDDEIIEEKIKEEVVTKNIVKTRTFKEYFTINFSSYYIEPLLAFGLLIGFFFPWIDFIFMKLSIYEVLKQNDIGAQSFFWLIPIFSVITILTSRFHKDLRLLTLVTGAIPYIIIATAMIKYGTDTSLSERKALSYGFYFTYILGFLMIARSLHRMIKEKSILNLVYTKKETIIPIQIKVKWINLFLALGLIISFFLPWANILVDYSGYALVNDGLISKYIWSIPIFAFFLIIATLLGDYILFPVTTGLLPFIFLITESRSSSNDVVSMLSYGGYLTLLLSLTLLILTLFRKHFFLVK